MHCPFCRNPDSRVVDSRETDEGQAIRRRRSCPECGRRFTTVETAVLAVVKRSGVTEPFSREKGRQRRSPGLPGPRRRRDALNLLAQQVEDTVRAAGSPEIPPSHEVGLAILGPLRELDEVAICDSRRCTARSAQPRTSSVRSRRCAPTGPSARRAEQVQSSCRTPSLTTRPAISTHPCASHVVKICDPLPCVIVRSRLR